MASKYIDKENGSHPEPNKLLHINSIGLLGAQSGLVAEGSLCNNVDFSSSEDGVPPMRPFQKMQQKLCFFRINHT